MERLGTTEWLPLPLRHVTAGRQRTKVRKLLFSFDNIDVFGLDRRKSPDYEKGGRILPRLINLFEATLTILSFLFPKFYTSKRFPGIKKIYINFKLY